MIPDLKIIPVITALILAREMVVAQVPVEVLAGDKKATLDIMFFRFFKSREGQKSNILFFNRTRAIIDYKMTKTTNLPQFGFTEAVSYNLPKFKGFAPVMVANILNRGLFPKAGIQYSRLKKEVVLFSWLVCETLKNPNIDFFFLGRYTPGLTGTLNLFTQVEFLNALPTSAENNFSFIQRFRLGLKLMEVQFGAGADFSESGRNDYVNTLNIGGFFRYEF